MFYVFGGKASERAGATETGNEKQRTLKKSTPLWATLGESNSHFVCGAFILGNSCLLLSK